MQLKMRLSFLDIFDERMIENSSFLTIVQILIYLLGHKILSFGLKFFLSFKKRYSHAFERKEKYTCVEGFTDFFFY